MSGSPSPQPRSVAAGEGGDVFRRLVALAGQPVDLTPRGSGNERVARSIARRDGDQAEARIREHIRAVLVFMSAAG